MAVPLIAPATAASGYRRRTCLGSTSGCCRSQQCGKSRLREGPAWACRRSSGIVQQHGGGVSGAEGRPGVGTTFRVWLPLGELAARRVRGLKSATTPGGRGARVQRWGTRADGVNVLVRALG